MVSLCKYFHFHDKEKDDNLICYLFRKQLELKQKVVVADSSVVRSILSLNNNQTYYIAGVDISFVKNNNVDACAALVILSYQELKVQTSF